MKQRHVHLIAICGVGMAPLAVMFRQAGWGTVVIDKAFELYFLHPVPMISATVVAIMAGVFWHERRTAKGKYNKKFPTYVLYVLMAAGAYFIGRYAIRGTL